ncbi:MAG: dimethylsulfonioproprionate lyase family protein [Halioglobus sp.]
MNTQNTRVGYWGNLVAILLGISGFTSLPGAEASPPGVVVADEVPWVDLRNSKGYNWSEAVRLMPTEVDRIDRVLRNRAVYRTEGFTIGHLLLGPGALYPYHAHASPEAYYVISGQGEWSVAGETQRIGPGTIAYHAPYANHRWITTSDEPLYAVWFQWVPDGDADLIKQQPDDSATAMSIDFHQDASSSVAVQPAEMQAPEKNPEPDTLIASMKTAWAKVHADEVWRQPNSSFYNSTGPWSQLSPGALHRAHQLGNSLIVGQVIIQPATTTELPAHKAPGVIHVLSGSERITVNGSEITSPAPGTTIPLAPGDVVSIETSDEPFRGLKAHYAPDGDMSYWARDYFLVEPVPEPPEKATLARDIKFFSD